MTVTSSELLFVRLIQLLSFFLWQSPYSCFLAILGSCHLLVIDPVSCSKLLFGRPEPWLSYFSNVPDLSCKDRSGGYWFICRFLAKVRMIIFLRSELEGCWTCHLMGYPVRKMRISYDCRKIAPTVPMVIRRSNMTQLFQPRIQAKKTIMKEQDQWCRRKSNIWYGSDTQDSGTS